LAIFAGLAASAASAQDDASDEKEVGWFNETEFSYATTEGNSDTETFGFRSVLRREWKDGRFRLTLDGIRADTAGNRFLLVEPGLTWMPGGTPPAEADLTTVEPPVKPDVEKYFVEATYDRQITKKLTWNVGASWDRNEDAGIVNRYIAFAGLGTVWYERDDLMFVTNYGVSYTDREEETADPLKDDTFTGGRISWDYMNKFGKVTTYDNDFTANVNLSDTSDYQLNMVNAITVAMSQRLSLKASLQWLYNNKPALEDVDIIARAILVDPDGTPGSGDEFFQTVASGGTEVEFGKGQILKDELDTVFRTSLVVSF
jgi:putative salt-induced outer membrane protein YdiY